MDIHPFTISVPQAALDDLQQRLALTRWPDEVPGAGWAWGTDLAYLRDLVQYWRTAFDWRAQERTLNALAHFQADFDGLRIHFIHARGVGPRPLPLILTHGWPSTFVEMLKVLPRLTDPARFGGDPADAFDVVVPSLPGFAFSARPPRGAMTSVQTARAWRRLMVEGLGYERFGAHGGDIGGGVTRQLGQLYPNHLIGIHTINVPGGDRITVGPGEPELTPREQTYLAEVERWDEDEGAYAHQQHTRPQTLAYGLTDSPAGLAAWIVEKFRAWSDCEGDVERRFTKDELLTNVTLYWLTGTINSSFGPYFASGLADDPNDVPQLNGRVTVPCAVAVFPKDLDRPPRELGERVYALRQWTEMPRGGHFPAQEEPDLLVADLRAFFRPLREEV